MYLIRAIVGLVALPILAQTPPAWVAKSNQNAQLLIDIGQRYSPEGASRDGVTAFDDRITAHYCGFTGADDYYARAAAANVIDRIVVPALIIHAANDPFIRLLPETRARILANPYVTYIETADGGHCAFLGQPKIGPGNDDYDGHLCNHKAIQRSRWRVYRLGSDERDSRVLVAGSEESSSPRYSFVNYFSASPGRYQLGGIFQRRLPA